ncbi:MAG: hypothetical protein WCH99_10210 [Verrucomicrobiota bacterium]
MTPVIRHLPLHEKPKLERDQDMTHEEITAWLDENDREIHRQRWNYVINFALGIVSVAIAFIAYQFFNR